MNKVELPEFRNYEEEAAFWDNLETSDMMADDGEWFHFSASQSLRDDVERNKGGENGYANDRIPGHRCNPPGAIPADSNTATLEDRRCDNGT